MRRSKKQKAMENSLDIYDSLQLAVKDVEELHDKIHNFLFSHGSLAMTEEESETLDKAKAMVSDLKHTIKEKLRVYRETIIIGGAK